MSKPPKARILDFMYQHGSITNDDARAIGIGNLSYIIQSINNNNIDPEVIEKLETLEGRITFDPNKYEKTRTRYFLKM